MGIFSKSIWRSWSFSILGQSLTIPKAGNDQREFHFLIEAITSDLAAAFGLVSLEDRLVHMVSDTRVLSVFARRGRFLVAQTTAVPFNRPHSEKSI